MNLREFSRRVESDLLKFERRTRGQHPKGEPPADHDYDDWLELFIDFVRPGFIDTDG